MKDNVLLLGSIGRYVRWRILELPVWLGIPALGLAAAGRISSLSELVLFCVAVIFAAWHVLLLNDWGGLVRNPAESARFVRGENLAKVARSLFWASVPLCVGSILLFGALRTDLAGLAIVGTTVSVLYSHPQLHCKELLFGAAALHFLGGAVQFLLGYCLFAALDARALLVAVFFSLVLVSGHFIHQCIDVDEDQQGRVETFATRFGASTSARIGLGLFFSSQMYLLALYGLNLVTLAETLILTFPLAVHLTFGKRILSGKSLPIAFLYRYREAYRGAFAISAITFIASKFH